MDRMNGMFTQLVVGTAFFAVLFSTPSLANPRQKSASGIQASITNTADLVISAPLAQTCVQLLTNREQWSDIPSEHAGLIAISERLWDSANWGTFNLPPDADELEVGVACLARVVNTDRYSPSLAKAWVKWRVRHQLYWHGASNSSEMPNALYNSARQRLLDVIILHLVANPTDTVAREQMKILRESPNVVPLPEGNSATAEWESIQPRRVNN